MDEPAPAPPEPYILPETRLREFSARALITGTVLGMAFGASSLYLVLKVGLTVSASIPVAVISLSFYRLVAKLGGRDATILENNLAQTAGSAGESIAFGVGATMPAILILGYDLDVTRVLLVGVLGGLLGILMMIPLRRALIVREHGLLKYPEGTACALVLAAGASAEDRAQASPSARADMHRWGGAGAAAASGGRVIFTGFLIGFVYKTLNAALRCWREVPARIFGASFKGGSVSAEISPELLGVGYIIGPRIAALMFGGGVLAYLVLIPLIAFFGGARPTPVAPGTIPIDRMSPDDIRSAYLLYIGAGAVAAGGIISLVRSLPTIGKGLRGGWRAVGGAGRGPAAAGVRVRTDRDLSMKTVGIGLIVLLAAIALAPPLHMNALGAGLVVFFGFLFVAVSSRLTGEIGSSSNPISGMTVATLLLTCLSFLLVGWKGSAYYVTALSVGAIVCIASSNGGSTSQDLKTGFLLGATPRSQQIAILVGAFASALIMGPLIRLLNDQATVYVPIAEVAPAGLQVDVAGLGPEREIARGTPDARAYRVWHRTLADGANAEKFLVDDSGRAVWLVDPGINGTHTRRADGSEVRKLSAPKAVLMSYIIKGILSHRLPWALVLLGVMTALTLELCGLPSLAFAVGVYLPLSTSAPIWAGGLVRGLVDWRRRRAPNQAGSTPAQLAAEADKSPGVLLASGYIAGGAIAGILIAFLAGVPMLAGVDASIERWAGAHNPFYRGSWADAGSLVPFLALVVLLYLVGREIIFSHRPAAAPVGSPPPPNPP